MEHGTARSFRSLLVAMTVAAPMPALGDHDFYGGDPDGRAWLASPGSRRDRPYSIRRRPVRF
ncbi:MAG: hypothetical protein M3R13_10515 [Armatimonadota bacterium]|nr:hypothetical protein [Armatimonadota bacterium]